MTDRDERRDGEHQDHDHGHGDSHDDGQEHAPVVDRRGRAVTSAANGARRLRRAPGGRRRVITVKVSDSEYDKITRRAADAGVSRQHLLVDAALTKTSATGQAVMTLAERRAMYTELFAARRQIAGIANNLNQIARALNAGHLPADTQDAVNAVQQSLERLDAVVEALAPPPPRKKRAQAPAEPPQTAPVPEPQRPPETPPPPAFEAWYEP